MRVRVVKAVLWALVGASLVALMARFFTGLGATTNLSDLTPWGLWIGLKLAGVAFAAGGFTIAAVVYVFQSERYHVLARRSVLLGFLGYTFFVVSLIVDLGLPWNIWRPVVFWNLHSPLFEVAWCVMLYLTVLALEFAPVVLERYRDRFQSVDVFYRFLKAATMPLVIFGIALSVLHQSSLGTLFAIMPHRQHPLFYSPIINVLFFVSCVAMGLGAVIVESHIAHWLYGRRINDQLLRKLGLWCAWIVGLFAVIRFADLAVRGKAAFLLEASFNGFLFWLEMAVLLLIPAVLLQFRKLRSSRTGLGWLAFAIVSGFTLSRVSVAGLSTITPTGTSYFPSGLEILMSLGLVPGIAVLIWMFLVENYEVWQPEEHLDAQPGRVPPPAPDPASAVWVGEGALGGFKRNSVAFVLAAAVGFAFLPHEALFGAGPQPEPVARSRGRNILEIDGDRGDFVVHFRHQSHIDRLGADDSCVLCHHMDEPKDKDTPCWRCHRDMWSPTDIFDHSSHERHIAATGAEDPCAACHIETDGAKRAEATVTCDSEGCHRGDLALAQAGTTVELDDPQRPRMAASYETAMHELCITCHKQKGPEVNRERLHECATCHAGEAAHGWSQ